MALEITQENIEETISEGVTLLDFWAEWCGPCRIMGPTIDELSDDYEGDKSISIGKVNVDEQKELAVKYGIRSIPTFVLVKDGEVVDKMTGAIPKEKLAEAVNKAK